MLPQKLTAEAIGTFALVFVGVLAISNNAGLLGVAFAHGLAIAVMAMALGTVSGGQFNPAVSFGLSLSGHQDWRTTLSFIPAQLGGAVLGSLAALAVAGPAKVQAVASGLPALGTGVSVGGGLLGEVIATAFLVLVIVKVAIHQRHVLGGLIVGLTIVADILAVGPLTGAAMNPARSFGPALVSGDWNLHWLYWVGPLIGAALGASIATFTEGLRPRPVPPEMKN
ncbi:MIP/aquaporin family protein [Deinococcus koreensis]|uniref:Aquaporin n=1 Tax=Deinococcus koreensis TaxID=2054903 RepID=A0A2K3V0L4_9DEIO|nr:aquaporin [Deinococcus koreensis]PNY82323.1 aquaporin [Deinococcus koreensis]